MREIKGPFAIFSGFHIAGAQCFAPAIEMIVPAIFCRIVKIRMRIGFRAPAFGLFFLLALLLSAQTARTECTRLELTEAGTGRKIFSAVLKDGAQVVLTWKNSLYGLDVTEVFESRSGVLVLTQVTFAGPPGSSLPAVSPADVDDLYQTGDAFTARGLAKAFRQIIYRVSEIGEPRMRIGERVVDFKREVGFGGGVILSTRGAGTE